MQQVNIVPSFLTDYSNFYFVPALYNYRYKRNYFSGMLSITRANNFHYIPDFQGKVDKFTLYRFEFKDTLSFVESNIINTSEDYKRLRALLTFKRKFNDIYNFGDSKWQNPKYHQYTVTMHMLRAMEEASKIVKGKHPELDKVLNPSQKQELLKTFDEEIAGIKKGTLYVLAMAFHDLDKFSHCKPRLKDNGEKWKVELESYNNIIYFDKMPQEDQYYWSFEDDTDFAIRTFKDLARKINLPTEAEQYVCNIISCHDNPLKYIVWKIESGKRNVFKLFEEMKLQTPIPLKELAMVYLADQSSKGESGWLDHLEEVSPWRCIFKSLLMERPLSDLNVLLEKTKAPTV